MRKLFLASALVGLLIGQAAGAETWNLMVPSVPFDDDSAAVPARYQPLERAAAPWHLCVVYPHLKDAYWLSVNFGMVEEASRLGVTFDLHEAGGYPNVARQIEQVAACAASGADALILGTVSYDALTSSIVSTSERMPVIAAVNDVADAGVIAKASVSWYDMGAAAGRVIAERHPVGSPPVRLAWFPGPEGAGWVRFVERGFREAAALSSAEIVATRFGDTGVEQQILLVEEVLEAVADLDYIVGSGPTAEAAVSLLRARGQTDRIGVVSTYVSHGVYRGIKRGRILAAPTDFAVEQGRLAIELAVRAIEGRLELRHAGPAIVTLTEANIDTYGSEGSLAPASFVPVFSLASERLDRTTR